MNIATDFNIDGTKTLETLEGPMAQYDIPTSLMARVSVLSKTPLMPIDAEGLSLLLVQKMFMQSVVPATLVHLSVNPFTSGDLEEGALMRSLFQFIPMDFWSRNIELLKASKALLVSTKARLKLQLATETDSEDLLLLQEAEVNFDEAEKNCQKIEQEIGVFFE